jgi:FkbM family methyltransferase
LPPAALCFDVGANIGDKSEALLEAGARVIAFEPNPEVWPELIARCGAHPNWSLVRSALGSTAAVATLYRRKSSGESGFIEQWESVTVGAVDVPLITLDAAVRHFGTPQYCKIDVEGWELEVLSGLSVPLQLISFEFHLTDADLAKTHGCLERLGELGDFEANLTPAETLRFQWPQWVPLRSLLDDSVLPEVFGRSIEGLEYGDVFVRQTRPAPSKASGNRDQQSGRQRATTHM